MYFTQAQKEVYAMLIENTGKHMLDSGSAYGRHWQRNQSKTIEDFNNEPEEQITYDSRYKEFERRVSVFHYLSELDIDYICEQFNELNRDATNWDSNFYGVSLEASEYLDSLKNQDIEIDELPYGESWSTFNTYNGDSDLSQVLQGSWIKINDEMYLILQIHGGCDVRGGYTNARLFKIDNLDGLIHEYLIDYLHPLDYSMNIEYLNVYDENGDIIAEDKVKELIEGK
tara:strand:- start:918 stop:1601 length:684 start_codon:yes stop_codon:yes gene_type:complete